jgi:hypothetical protein
VIDIESAIDWHRHWIACSLCWRSANELAKERSEPKPPASAIQDVNAG